MKNVRFNDGKIYNRGFEGLAVREGNEYRFYMFAKTETAAEVEARLVSSDGVCISDSHTFTVKGFWQELTEDIMPVFETQYRTYAKDVTPDDFKATRRHRAFGGFSMGAAATWGVFEHCLNSVAYYLPMSGDCWALGMKAGGTQPDATAKYLADAVKASGWSKNDYYIYSGCGSKDIAEPNLTPQVEAMKKMTDAFVWCDNFADGNLYECIIENGGHDVNTVIRVMFNGLPKMFG